MFAPEQNDFGPGLITVGRGLTVTMTVCGGPKQAPMRGVMVMVATWGLLTLAGVMGILVVLVPDAAKPMSGLSLVQL